MPDTQEMEMKIILWDEQGGNMKKTLIAVGFNEAEASVPRKTVLRATLIHSRFQVCVASGAEKLPNKRPFAAMRTT